MLAGQSPHILLEKKQRRMQEIVRRGEEKGHCVDVCVFQKTSGPEGNTEARASRQQDIDA